MFSIECVLYVLLQESIQLPFPEVYIECVLYRMCSLCVACISSTNICSLECCLVKLEVWFSLGFVPGLLLVVPTSVRHSVV